MLIDIRLPFRTYVYESNPLFSLSLRPMRSAFQFLLRDIFPSFYFYSDSFFDRQDFVVSVCVCVCEAHFSIHLLTISIGQTDVYDEGPRQKNSIYICGQTQQHNGNGNKQKTGRRRTKGVSYAVFPL